MNEIPGDLKFKTSHEWVRVEQDGTVTVGISDHAQDLLGDIVFVELPDIGTQMNAEDEVAIVESVKAASDIYAPVSGTVQEINEGLDDSPETVNQDPYGDGWFFKLRANDDRELDELLDADAYKELCESEEH